MMISGLEYDSTDKELMQIYKNLRDNDLIEEPIKNFSRFDRLTKLSFLTYLSSKDDLNFTNINISKTALLFVDTNGSLEANEIYYKDYIDCGKILARGNYFIYTLATSPLAELSIYLGVQGPLQYLASVKCDKEFVLGQAKNMIENNEAQNVLAFYKDGNLLKVIMIKEDEQE